jgi:hypothetical protein
MHHLTFIQQKTQPALCHQIYNGYMYFSSFKTEYKFCVTILSQSGW